MQEEMRAAGQRGVCEEFVKTDLPVDTSSHL